MAEQNIKINVKTDTGYDTLYPQTKANLVTFNGSGITAKEVNGAILEVKGKVDTAQSTANTAKSTATTAQSTANTAKSTADTAKSKIDNAIKTKESLGAVNQTGSLVEAKAVKDFVNAGIPFVTASSKSNILLDGNYKIGENQDGKGIYLSSFSKYFANFNSVDLNSLTITNPNKKIMYIVNAYFRPDSGSGQWWNIPYVSKSGNVTQINVISNTQISITNNANWSGYILQVLFITIDV